MWKKCSCVHFADKLNYSGFDKPMLCISNMYLKFKLHLLQGELESLHGVGYSEHLRLPYLKHHVVDPMHKFLLGTGKHVMTVWKEQGFLQFELIQGKLDRMRVPSKIGRIPHKISSNFASLTAEKKLVYSLYCLHSVLSREHFSCSALFVEACCYLLQPCIS